MKHVRELLAEVPVMLSVSESERMVRELAW